MMAAKLGRPKRPNMRRAVILFPSGLTLFNLFFGIFAIITATRGDYRRAGIYVLLGGICDALDGRVARATNAGSQFGEELDSLVDAISFGLAPAMIMYFAVLKHDGWDWVFVFLFAACAVMRLARFNIEQAGTAKTYFSGLPSPAAGCTLASYYWFSQSWLYDYGAIGNLPWQEMLRFLMAALAALMISPIPYPVFPRTGWRSMRALAGTLLLIGSATLLATKRLEFFFPLCLLYVAWGPVRWLLGGLFERRQPTVPYDLSEGEDDAEEDEEFEVVAAQAHVTRPDRGTRPPREERPRTPRGHEDESVRSPREDRPARPDRADRPDRPQRTEAERAARREKREKRDKREGRAERTPRPPRTEAATVPADDAAPPADGELALAPALGGEVIGSIAEGTDSLAPAAGADGAPARKRKRRRRRGERKERGPADGSVSGTDADAGSAGDDEGSDDGPDESESRSPYSVPPAAPPSAPAAAPAPASPPPPSREPNE